MVVWETEADANSFNLFRSPSERDSIDIPIDEYKCAMRFVLAQQAALNSDDLKKQTSIQMGFARMGNNLDEILSYALEQLKRENKVEEIEGRVKNII